MNIGELVALSSKHYAPQEAIVFEDKTYTFSEVNERVNRLANSLTKLSLKKGDRVALLLYNCNQYIEADFAIAKCGLVKVALNTRLTDYEHEYMINNSEASVLILDSSFSEHVVNLVKSTPSLKKIICVGGEKNQFIDYEQLIVNGAPQEPSISVSEEDIYTIMYTSGTSGRPKGVVITHKNYLSMVFNIIMERDIRRGDRMLHAAPLTHASGSWVLPHFAKGAVNFILKHPNIELLIKTIQTQKITTIMVVPTTILRLLVVPGINKNDIGSLRSIIYGGSPMPLEKLKEAIAKFGSIFSQNYGQTEALTTITYLPMEYHKLDDLGDDIKRLSSAGYPYIKVKVKVVNEEDFEVRLGEIGEIVVKSEHVMNGYWKNEEATKEKIIDGWLHTGDMGKIDERGFVYIVDRKNDLIITGGFNVYPREVEEVIYLHPLVAEAAVIGVPDDQWVEAVKAFVVLKKDAHMTDTELISFCKQNMASIKAPKSVEFVNRLPQNPHGKIAKQELKNNAGTIKQ